MLNPTYQPMLTDEKLNKNLKNASEAEMTRSFSSSHGIFCMCWKIKDQHHSIWCTNLKRLLNIYFALKSPMKELLYIPPAGKIIKVFRRSI